MSEISATLDILTRLIAFDTTSRNSNLELIAWVEDFLGQRGITSRRVSNADGSKANLYAVVGPDVPGGIVLSGHTDVVPVDDQPWSSDPWVLSERGGKLYGRGTADMKAFIALALAHVDGARAAALKRPIVLALSYDEEIGCLGAPAMIAELAKQTSRPSAVIVGEPTSMKVVSAHKGVRSFIVEVTGREGHSSLPDQGVSAVMEAVKLMALVAEMGEEARAATHAHFNPPGPTMTIGKVEGGTASNILARRCSFIWDCRCPETAQGDAIEQRFRAVAAKIDADIKVRAPEGGVSIVRRTNTPGLAIERDSEAEILARALTGDNETRAVAYAAEAGLFQRAGIPAIICGPGSIEQAHQPDEWIERSQIEEGALFMQRLIAHLSA
ncbi:acetylornithine deacetylase [Candidatus Viadribacter manganicus]|uniref:Acetylornithine deacetylase n=1 Tax=Candidatus Viadribacter manganicus TaxID=1759059 RepID=A0A1B1AG07_9PROT|nr:acetylornithine deacetylase [Candidatus Viadribacter manganicus]ANP45484.1 acetylornithine deacetylase [Candidatus Viadribacter manganicus]